MYVETVPVKEMFQDQTVWEGEVEVFDLPDSPKQIASMLGRTRQTMQTNQAHSDSLACSARYSPELAVRASIIQDYREGMSMKH